MNRVKRIPLASASSTFVLLASLVASGCIRGAVSVAKPTALEHQLLGAYQELDRDLMHASSMRGPNEVAVFEKKRAEALAQRALQRFNEDDLDELKRGHCIAERLDAHIVARPCELTGSDESAARRIARVVREENGARDAILTWAAYELVRREGRPFPSPDELAEVRTTYQKLLRETAKPEHLVETEPGVFREAAR